MFALMNFDCFTCYFLDWTKCQLNCDKNEKQNIQLSLFDNQNTGKNDN